MFGLFRSKKVRDSYPLTGEANKEGVSKKFELHGILSEYQRLVSEFYTLAAGLLSNSPEVRNNPGCKIRQRTLLYYNSDIRQLGSYLEILDDYLFQASKVIPSGSNKLRANIHISVRRDVLINIFLLGEAILKDMHYQSYHLESIIRIRLHDLMEDIRESLENVDPDNEIVSRGLVNDYERGVNMITNEYKKLVSITSKQFPNVLKKISSYMGLSLTTTIPPVSTIPPDIDSLCALDKEVHARTERQRPSQNIMKQYE